MSDLEDVFKLLTFPVTSNAFINYKPGSSSSSDLNLSSKGSLGTSSPPRKTARLEGDIDHSSSVNRTQERGRSKGKGKATESNSHVVQTIGIEKLPCKSKCRRTTLMLYLNKFHQQQGCPMTMWTRFFVKYTILSSRCSICHLRGNRRCS